MDLLQAVFAQVRHGAGAIMQFEFIVEFGFGHTCQTLQIIGANVFVRMVDDVVFHRQNVFGDVL